MIWGVLKKGCGLIWARGEERWLKVFIASENNGVQVEKISSLGV